MSDSVYSIAWNRQRLAWSKRSESAPWLVEAILMERVLLEGRPQMRIVARLAGILEDKIDDLSARDQFWSAAQHKLGKMRRLNHRGIWQIESLLAQRIPKAAPAKLATKVRPSAHSVRGPHQPVTLRSR
jgi:hypothetical protein